MTKLLTKPERMSLHTMREDYLEIFHTMPELREEKPELWHGTVDQWEIIKQKLDDDEWEKIKSTSLHRFDSRANRGKTSNDDHYNGWIYLLAPLKNLKS